MSRFERGRPGFQPLSRCVNWPVYRQKIYITIVLYGTAVPYFEFHIIKIQSSNLVTDYSNVSDHESKKISV